MSPLRMTLATAVLILAAAAPASAAGTTVFGGSTRAGEPIALTANRNASKLRSIVVAVDAKCADGNYESAATRLNAKLFAHNGNGRFTGVAVRTSSDLVIASTLTVSGRLAAHRASGTLRLDVVSTDGSADCHSGTIRWSATRSPGRLYAGATSQQEPVVVKVNPKHTKVNDVLIGWETASCTPDNWYRQSEDLTDFPLRASHFGDGFSNTFEDGNGGKITLDYTIDGTVKRSASKGTLHVGLTHNDATGATAMSCDSGSVAWNAITG